MKKYKARPKIKIELTATDKVMEIIGWLGLSAIWVLILTNYSNLPESIPTHFNGSGQPDRFGAKGSIIISPVIATFVFLFMTLLNSMPHIFNYLVEITEENALSQYTNATKMMRYLKLIIVVIFGLISIGTIQSSTRQSDGLGVWFLPFTLGIIFIPMAYFIIKSLRTK